MAAIHPIEASALHARRERVFLVLAGLFLGTLAMLNVLGISRFVDLSFDLFGWRVPMVVAVGVLPYPMTFLCTDLISELYGQARANAVVWMGLLLNLWVMAILWLGGVLPGTEATAFFAVRELAFGAVAASMVAYLAAQFCDVHVFHFWKRLTRGKHLWLRNNGSTLVSQLVDTTAVILVTHYYAHALPIRDGEPVQAQLLTFIASGYAFKAVAALLDTGPIYLAVRWLERYLEIDAKAEHDADREESAIDSAR
ncbi:MAG: queuosine precursor transporter [Deltaproteobacteria bacterium]|nr:queuosine precursor transporter [Deltaproteobacteria bacterium]